MHHNGVLLLLDVRTEEGGLGAIRASLSNENVTKVFREALLNVKELHFLRISHVRREACDQILLAMDLDGEQLEGWIRISESIRKCGLGKILQIPENKNCLEQVFERRIQPSATFRAMRGLTRRELEGRIQRLEEFQRFFRSRQGWCDGAEAHRVWISMLKPMAELFALAHQSVTGRPASVVRSILAIPAVLRLIRSHGQSVSVDSALAITRSLDRFPEYRLINRLFRNPPTNGTPLRSAARQAKWRNAPALHDESLFSQNPLTLFSPIRVNAGAVERLQATLGIIDLYSRKIAPTGRLLDIQTIHSAYWCIVDGGRYLLFASNYDGGWDGYIDEFGDMIGSGLDAIWGSDPIYPVSGSADVRALKQYLAQRECETLFYFSAYSRRTLAHITHPYGLLRIS